MARPRVTFVLPTLGEEAIFRVIAEVRARLGRNAEFIAVARGGRAYFRKLRRLGVRVVYQKIKNVEGSIMIGFALAKGGALASTDADDTHGMEGLARAVRMVESGEADLVLGDRTRGIQKGSMSRYLRFGNAALSLLFSLLYRTRVHDVLTGFFVISRRAYESIREVKPYRAGIAFFAIEVAKRGYRIREVNITYHTRRYGVSQLSRFKVLWGIRTGLYMLQRVFG